MLPVEPYAFSSKPSLGITEGLVGFHSMPSPILPRAQLVLLKALLGFTKARLGFTKDPFGLY